ncbi:hypothetical protein WJX79_006890 [Trebouxia sp. C0005]
MVFNQCLTLHPTSTAIWINIFWMSDLYLFQGMTALHYAARIGHASLVDLLFKHGCEVAARTDQGLTALDFAMQQGHVSAVAALQAQLHRQEDVKAFHQAAKEGNATVVKELLTKGMLADVKATDGFTPLHRAANKGHEPVARLLLTHGAKSDARTLVGFTALHLAAIGGHLKVVQLLVAYGADATAQTQEGMTALHLAAKGGKITVAEYLLTQSLLLDMQNNQGMSALHLAAKDGQDKMVTFLLQCGAKPKLKSVQGCTALEWAMKGNQPACVTALQAWSESQKVKVGQPAAMIQQQEPATSLANTSTTPRSPGAVPNSPGAVPKNLGAVPISCGTASRSPNGELKGEAACPAKWQSATGALSGQWRTWTAAEASFKSLAASAASVATEHSVTTSSGVLCDVFHHFSSVASALCHAASPVVPGLYVVGMALKELDNIVQKNQIADAVGDKGFSTKMEALLEPLWSTMKECADFLENQPSKWSWRRLVTSNDRKLNANALQKRLSDFVKKMQVANFVLTADVHRCTVELNKQVDECTRTLEQQYGVIQAGLTRLEDSVLQNEGLSWQQQRTILLDKVIPDVRRQLSLGQQQQDWFNDCAAQHA